MAVSQNTNPVEVQKPESTANNAAAAAPRKRRRRAPATGATEDCFACRKRSVKCDRRRPYCGQCIEIGKECTGYRTTLTWGVGVASRGKLRGMSLPVAKSSPQTSTQEVKAQSRNNSSASASTVSSSNTRRDSSTAVSRASIDFGKYSPPSPPINALYSAPPEFSYTGSTSPIAIPNQSGPMGYGLPMYGDHMDYMTYTSPKMSHPHAQRGPLQRLHTSLRIPFDESRLSASTASLDTYSDSDFPSPSEFPHTPADEFPFSDSSIPRLPYGSLDQVSMCSLDNFFMHEAPRSLPLADDMSSSVSSDQSLQDYTESSTAPLVSGQHSYSDAFVEGGMSPSFSGFQPGFSFLPSEGTFSYGPGPLSLDLLSLTNSIPQSLAIASPLSPRILFLLDYYDKFICPVLVAFDSPANPYRMHIIHHAMRNEELQYAIAALATNNMRMRGGIEGRRLSFQQDHRLIPEHAYSEMTTQELREMHGEPTSEEKHYKATSITLLNKKLANLEGSQDDAVLATLLILCLFHVCDSGFTKFKTQLAGVQKLLSLRDRTVQSDFVGWIETFFTWFDVMTAAVNDRDIEVRGDSLDMMNLSANLGAMEHHSGCEGRLFKLIARLGRLNLLSQNRPVRESHDTPTASPRTSKLPDFYSFDFNDMDGNGWGTPIRERSQPFISQHEDSRSAFWAEWNDLRIRLQEWEFPPVGESSTTTGSASLMVTISPAQAALLHISESFRYAALLYTERLAHPLLPASAPNFQTLVTQGLFHASQIGITSCVNKFLLWPLFIIGTECADPEHRAVIRQRCVEIQRESGFFNNLSGLEVLERVWREDDEGVNETRQQASQAFRWRNAMTRVDGEYIVI